MQFDPHQVKTQRYFLFSQTLKQTLSISQFLINQFKYLWLQEISFFEGVTSTLT
jgi:hypothetical protein